MSEAKRVGVEADEFALIPLNLVIEFSLSIKGCDNMSGQRVFRISVGTAAEYDEYIAEIAFTEKLGLIISQERGEGDFEISLHSFFENAREEYSLSRNKDEHKIPLVDLQEAISLGMKELTRLKRT